jgi:glycopeptide antibiotics resistance protein
MIVKALKYLKGGRIFLPIFIAGMLLIIRIKSIRKHSGGLINRYHFLDYAPNLIAAFCLPFLFMYFFIYSGNNKKSTQAKPVAVNRNKDMIYAGVIAMVGLLAWEFIQLSRPNRTFDAEDIAATVAGVVLFWVIMFIVNEITKKIKPNNM